MENMLLLTGVLFLLSPSSVFADEWKCDSKGWWYQYSNGSYVQDDFRLINGVPYYFDENGYMVCDGWHMINGTEWIYAYPDGHLAESEWIGNYYINPEFIIETGGIVDGYLIENGSWDGYPAGSWRWSDYGGWWYQLGNGEYLQGYVFMCMDGMYHTYLFDESGYMRTGWVNEQGDLWEYYDTTSGDLVVEQWIGDYYVDSEGYLVTDAVVDGYYVDASGKWNGSTDSGWRWSDYGGWWYNLGNDVYPANILDFQIYNKNKGYCDEYAFDEYGYMRTGWVWDDIERAYRYYNDSGERAFGKVVDGYWVDYVGFYRP